MPANLASSKVLAWIFTVQEIARCARMPGRKSGKNAVVMGKIAAAVREMHRKRGTGLWTGCTRLIFQQINRSLFY